MGAELAKIDALVVPLVMVVLWQLLGDFRLLAIPAFSLILSFSISSVLVVQIARRIPVSTDALPVMATVTVAFNLDYALFVLTRHVEALRQHSSLVTSLQAVIRHTVPSVIWSGVLVVIAFVGACSLPLQNFCSTFVAAGFSSRVEQNSLARACLQVEKVPLPGDDYHLCSKLSNICIIRSSAFRHL